MKAKVVGGITVLLAAFLAMPLIAQEKKGEESKKAAEPEKAKAEKVAGDIGLLGTEKNYMIVVKARKTFSPKWNSPLQRANS